VLAHSKKFGECFVLMTVFDERTFCGDVTIVHPAYNVWGAGVPLTVLKQRFIDLRS
jgi:hypothetical protein